MQTSTIDIRSVCERISEIRDKFADSIALSNGRQQLSWDELDLRADRFAGYLTELGVMRGSTVAICMERSFEWIIAALGIMRSGAAYVPLDSAWPDSRLRFAVEDSDATVLVARSTLLDRLCLKVRAVDPFRDATAIAETPRLERRPTKADDLAYVIYTSGSTGVPKGVEITHANLCLLIEWHQGAFNVTREDRASHLAGLGFDAAVWEIWPNLSAGATVCLADDAVRSSPELIQEWMIRECVTIAFVPTVHAAPLMAMEWPAAAAPRILLTGGDTLHRAPAARLPFAVVNNYGPTECTVVATSSVLKPGSHGTPPIGRPIAATNIYLLDENGEQVPDGDVGEIYIGGGGVGRGYRNLPDITKQTFLPDPFVGAPSARMYRTGDCGLRRPDGEIEFRGRLDRQTKIRGQRVELDEIGGILARHPSLGFAIVAANTSGGGENQLIAYVLPKKNKPVPTVRELQEHLRQGLPDYMVPATFVRLQTVPLSPNGKIDPAALPPPTDSNMLKRAPARPPASPIEAQLLTMMRGLLENDAITAEENIFLAGGHSLLGAQLVMRLRNTFGLQLTLRQLFEAPTVERLALLVERRLTEERLAAIWTNLLGIKPVGSDVNFFDAGGRTELLAALRKRILTEFGRNLTNAELIQSPTLRQQAELLQGYTGYARQLPPGVLALRSHGTRQGIFWVHYLSIDLARAMGDDQPFFNVRLTTEDRESFGKAPSLEEIAACLTGKILATQPTGPYTIGGYCLGGMLAYEIACQLQATGQEVSRLLMLDTPSPSYFESPRSLAPRLSHPLYLLKRAKKLGPRTTLIKLRESVFMHLTRVLKPHLSKTEIELAQELIEAAVATYQPSKYGGKTVLLLASDHAPNINFLPGWKELLHDNLHAEYLNGHHSELTRKPTASSVANVMVSHLMASI